MNLILLVEVVVTVLGRSETEVTVTRSGIQVSQHHNTVALIHTKKIHMTVMVIASKFKQRFSPLKSLKITKTRLRSKTSST